MLRPATEDDVERMRTWRNQQANREVSVHQHEITPEEHAAWWERCRQDDSRRVLVWEAEGRPLGVVTFFDITSTGAGWGFYLDHDTTAAEGTTMTAWAAVMQEACDYAFDVLGVERLTGEVLGHNEAVRVMNKQFRFTEGEPAERTVDGRTVTAVPLELRREHRRGGSR